MDTKMKGLLKGLRYISQIFEEEKEQEIQIGFPTDVKHVAHIGQDGPYVDSPSWLKEFKSPTEEEPDIKWVSEDSKRSTRGTISSASEPSELTKSTTRHNSAINNNATDSPKKKDKSRQSKRHSSKETLEGNVISNRLLQETGMAIGWSSSPSRNLPDITKKSGKKKSRELVNVGRTSRPRSKVENLNRSYDSQYSNVEPDSNTILRACDSQMSLIPSLDGEKEGK